MAQRLRAVVIALATMVLAGLLPGATLISIALDGATTQEPPPLPAGTDDRVGVARVTVRTLDGRPLAGAIVRALLVRDGAAYLAARAMTGADGVASLGALPVGAHWIIAEAPSLARASTQRFVGEEPIEIELRLGAERPLTIDVHDELGRAVDGADVEVRCADPLPRGARTGSDGVARASGIGDGPLRVTIRAPGYDELTMTTSATESHPRAVLRKLGSLTVTVVDRAGKPASGAIVAIAGGALAVARTTSVGEDGVARVSGLPSGSYDLRATRGDEVAPTEIGIALRRGADATARLVLEPGRTVRVHVVDESERAIVGAELVLVEGGVSPFPIETTADASGDARLGPTPRDVMATLGARATGFVPRGPIVVAPGSAIVDPIVIVLRRAATLVGDVRDAAGRPIDGATIEVVGADLDGLPIDVTPAALGFQSALFARSNGAARTLLPMGELGVVPGPVPPIPHGKPAGAPVDATAAAAIAAIEPWVTRADGSFRATPVSAGRLRAIVRHPDYVEAISAMVTVEPGGEARVTVVLAAGGRLFGRVRDDRGAAVEGAYVEVSARSGSLTRGVRTASDGSYVLAAVPAEVSLTLAPPDRPYEIALRRDVTVTEGKEQELNLTLPAPRDSASVHVDDDRHYPIEGAQVTISSLDPSTPLKTTSFTDAHGDATLPRVAGLHAQLEVLAPGHASHREVTDVKATSSITLTQGVLVAGVVYAPGGRITVEGAAVSLLGEAGVRRTTTDKEGHFSFADVATGPATIELRAVGTAGLRRTIEVAPSGSRPELDLGRLEVEAAGAIEGDVVDERGRAVAGARVARDHAPTYVPAGAAPPGVAMSDGSGAFKLGDVGVGDVALEAYAADVGRGRVEHVHVDEGRTTSRVRIVVHAVASGAPDDLAPGGVAITLGESEGKVMVVSVASGSEAERAGFAAGDELASIDGVAVSDLTTARTRLSGPIAADVIVVLRRSGEERSLRVVREATQR